MDDTAPTSSPSPSRTTGELTTPVEASAPGTARPPGHSSNLRIGILIRAGEQLIFIAAIVGAVALGLGISDYFRDHAYISAYLIAYIGFRIAELLIGDKGYEPAELVDPPSQRITNEVAVLVLFAAAPFERTYLYGGEPARWVGVLGLIIELAGLWLALGARIQLHFFSSDKSGRERTVLVKTGFFRYLRHPAYAGVILVLFAWPLVFAAPIVAVITLIVGFTIARRQIRTDEAQLAARFGAEFEDYQRVTDALIPSVW